MLSENVIASFILLVVSLPALFLLGLLLLIIRNVIRTRILLSGKLRHLPVAPRTAHSVPSWMSHFVGDGDWGPVGERRGISGEFFADKVLAAKAKCGPIFHLRAILGRPFVVLMDLDDVRSMLVRDSYKYVKVSTAKRLLGPLIGCDGLVLLEGERHRQLRRRIAPSMHHEAVQKFSALFLAEAVGLREAFLRVSKTGAPIQLSDGAGTASCRAILRSFFPVQVLSKEREDLLRSLYASVVRSIGNILPDLVLQQVLFFVPSKYLTTHASDKMQIKAISERMLGESEAIAKERPEDIYKDHSMVSHFLRVKKDDTLSKAEQVDNLLTFLIAGQTTTAFSLAYTIWRLAKHPDLQTRLQAELDSCPLLRDESADPQARVDAICELPFLTCFIKESLRMHPPVFFSNRMVETPVNVQGYDLPHGTIVSVPIYAIHMDPDVYVEPKKFNPDRFLPEQERERDSMAFLPFIFGPRSCMGRGFALRELCVFVAEVASHLSFSVLPDAPDPIPSASGIIGYPNVDIFAKERLPRETSPVA